MTNKEALVFRENIIWPVTWTMLQAFGLGFWFIRQYKKDRRWGIIAYPYAAVFILLDVIYNIIFGSFLFWEKPEELVFTSRLEKHKKGTARNSTIASQDLAYYYCERLNEHDPGHC